MVKKLLISTEEEDAWVLSTIERWKTEMERFRNSWRRYADTYRSDFYADPHYGEQPTVASVGDTVADTEDSLLSESNYLFPFVESLIAAICPPSPEVTIKARRRALEGAAALRTELVNDFFKREAVFAKMWKVASRACIYPRAFLKMTWSDKRRAPRLRVINPEMVFFDVLAEEWEDVRYVCELTLLTRGEFLRRVKRKVKGREVGKYDLTEDELRNISFGALPQNLRADTAEQRYASSDAANAYQWVPVYEFHDLVGRRVYHVVEGVQKPVFVTDLPVYQLLPNPFWLVAFNDNLADIGGLSDAKLVHNSLARINELSSLELSYLHTAIPVPVIHEGLVDDADEFIEQYEKATAPGHVIRLSAPPRTAIRDVLGSTITPSLPIEWSRASARLVEIIEFVLGLPSFARGQTGGSDIATDLALADNAIRTRNSKRQKVLYAALEWVAKACINLYIEYLPPDADLPMRFLDEGSDVSASRSALAFPPPGEDGEITADDPWNFDYTALVFNGDEDNRVVRVKTLLEAFAHLVANPDVDQRLLTKELLNLLKMTKVLASSEDAQSAREAAKAPEMTATPEGVGPLTGAGVPDAAAGALTGGQVPMGNGAQAVDSGASGGSIPLV